jgi:glycine hydroxymethyltransferase
LAALALDELHRQATQLNLVAASSPTLPRALAVQALAFSSVTAEGYAGRRYHPGTAVVDRVETVAQQRAGQAFRSPHANVQPLSGSAANLALLYGLLRPGDRVLSMHLADGGHLSHVSEAASISRWIASDHYGVDADGRVDLDAVLDLARATRPRVIVCGGSAVPRAIDFAGFRRVADEVGALLVADISHISGLIAAGIHRSPVPVCDAVTTSTYKQLCGPRGGLILLGAASELSAQTVDRAVFPGFQGTPDFGTIAAKAVALRFAATGAFAEAMGRVARFAKLFADAFLEVGLTLVSGGTDTHMVLVDLRGKPVSGRAIGDALQSVGVLVNKNLVPGDTRTPHETSGLRMGTNDLAFRRLSDVDAQALARELATVVAQLADGAQPTARRLAGLRAAACDVVANGYRTELGLAGDPVEAVRGTTTAVSTTPDATA